MSIVTEECLSSVNIDLEEKTSALVSASRKNLILGRLILWLCTLMYYVFSSSKEYFFTLKTIISFMDKYINKNYFAFSKQMYSKVYVDR